MGKQRKKTKSKSGGKWGIVLFFFVTVPFMLMLLSHCFSFGKDEPPNDSSDEPQSEDVTDIDLNVDGIVF